MTEKQRYKKSEPLKRLEQLAHSKECEKHPTLAAEYIPRKKYKDDSANALTKSIIALIGLIGGQAERINTSGRVVARSRKGWQNGRVTDIITREYIPTAGVRGSADISATICGRSVKVEVKYGRDRQSEAQKDYQTQIERAGGYYIIARTFEQFAASLLGVVPLDSESRNILHFVLFG